MNKQEYLDFHKAFCNQMIEITAKKNNDYALDTDPFSNFKKAELLGICSNEAGFLVRIMDKISRIINYLNKGKLLVEDESVTDSLLDCANYCILLAGYIKSKQTADNNIFTDLDEDILDILSNTYSCDEYLIFDKLQGIYTYVSIAESLTKLSKLKLIRQLDNDDYIITDSV